MTVTMVAVWTMEENLCKCLCDTYLYCTYDIEHWRLVFTSARAWYVDRVGVAMKQAVIHREMFLRNLNESQLKKNYQRLLRLRSIAYGSNPNKTSLENCHATFLLRILKNHPWKLPIFLLRILKFELSSNIYSIQFYLVALCWQE